MDLALPEDGESCLVGALRDYFGADDLSGEVEGAAGVAVFGGGCRGWGYAMSLIGRGGWVRVVVGVALVAGVFALLAVYGFRQGHVEAQFSPGAGTGPGLPETIEAIDAARVTARILYIDAHPDDESAAVLTYLARGLHADVALLSVTRGEGGQNDLGPEQNPQLGLIRTQELLAATRGYGVHLFFTRARDFGFSKTPEETEKIWGDQVLEDMVRVIRTFRPNIVINNFGGVHSGDVRHQAAGLWTSEAVKLAADPAYDRSSNPVPSTESPKDLPREFEMPWGGKDRPIQILDVDRSGG